MDEGVTEEIAMVGQVESCKKYLGFFGRESSGGIAEEIVIMECKHVGKVQKRETEVVK